MKNIFIKLNINLVQIIGTIKKEICNTCFGYYNKLYREIDVRTN